MSTLVYINSRDGIAKNAYEAITYASKLGQEVIAITTGNANDSLLATAGEYGASKILVDKSVGTDDAQQITRVIASAVETTGANTIVFSNELVAKAVAPRLSVRLKAGLISGAIATPEGNTVKVNVFSGKAFGAVKINSDKKIISLLPNSIQPEQSGTACSVEEFNGNAGEAKIKLLETKKPEGEIPLPEAELVVSAGRGLKGPENWGMIEDLAKELGAACSVRDECVLSQKSVFCPRRVCSVPEECILSQTHMFCGVEAGFCRFAGWSGCVRTGVDRWGGITFRGRG